MESGTIEQTLPGLESDHSRPEVTTGHAIPLTPQKRLMVFAGRSHMDLAEKIAERLGVQLGEIELTSFANGETYCRYKESIRGADVFLVQTGCEPVDRNLMELLLMIQAAKLASAKRITAVIPLVRVRAPGSQGEAARADLGAPHRGHAPAGRRGPRADDGPARRPGSGLLHDPGRPHDRPAALRALLPRHGPHGRGDRLRRARRRSGQVRAPVRRDDRGRLRDHAQDPAGARPG